MRELKLREKFMLTELRPSNSGPVVGSFSMVRPLTFTSYDLMNKHLLLVFYIAFLFL
jgi:hypothetical protein